MKKLFALVLALSMMATLSTTVLAATVTDEEGSNPLSIPVRGVNQPLGTDDVDVISADITWGAMECTYRVAEQGEWNPETHNYDEAVEPAWSYNGNEITVTNHSNVAVTAFFTFEATEGLEITENFTKVNFFLPSAVGATLKQAPSDTTAFTIESGSIAESGDIGTISVSIEKAQQEAYDSSRFPVYQVSTAEELLAAIGPARVIELMDVIDLGQSTLTVRLSKNETAPTLHLKGYGIEGSGESVIDVISGSLYITSGWIKNTGSGYAVKHGGEHMELENLTLIGGGTSPAFFCAGNCVVNTTSFSMGRTENKEIELVAPGRITAWLSMPLSGPIDTPEGTEVIFEWGTYNVDPRDYTVADGYTVIENENGTWTVADPSDLSGSEEPNELNEP